MIAHCFLVVLLAAACGCGDRGGDTERSADKPREKPPSRRVIEPPVGTVRPLPPHLISAAGVGPYHLGDRLSDLMQQLPSGPRMALFEINGIVHRSLLRAEEGDSVLVGGEPGSLASFIAVVDADVARTEAGLHVGATRSEVEAVGAPTIELDRARDPRIVVPSAPKGAKLLFAQGRGKGGEGGQRVAAIVLTNEGTRSEPAAGGCVRPVPSGPADAIRAGRVFGVCLSGIAPGEIVQWSDGELVVRSPDSDKPLYAPIPLRSGVQFVAPLRIEDRDELVFVVRGEAASERTWSVFALRMMESGKFMRTAEGNAYTVTAANARWIGVELPEIDLLLELSATKDSLEVSGLLVTQVEGPQDRTLWRDVVTLTPSALPRRHGKSALSEGSASADGSARPPGPDGGSPSANGSGTGAAP